MDIDEKAQADILFNKNAALEQDNAALRASIAKAAAGFIDAKLEAHNIMKRLLAGNDIKHDELMRIHILGQMNDYIRFLSKKMEDAGLAVR